MAEAALALSPEQLLSGARAELDFSIDEDQMRAFAHISGDFNPLHLDDEFARQKGFSGKVVYGALLVAKLSQLIGMRLPGRDSVWAALKLDFRSPLYVGEAAQLSAVVASYSESTGMAELKIELRRAGKLLAKGSAEVLVGQ